MLQYIMLRQKGLEVTEAIFNSMATNFLLAIFCVFISNNMKYYLPRREKYGYILVVSATATFIWLLLLQAVFWMFFANGSEYIDMIQSSWAIWFAFGFLLISSMSMFSLVWYSQEEQKETESRRAEAEKLSRDAELFKLRQQLQPHFLFNSLNSISALTGSNPEKARRMIQQLSDFLRGTLRKNEHQYNTLEEEIKYLELYLEIEKVRFGHRLLTEINYDPEILSAKLPALLLQPVVENAIKFGLYDTIGQVLIKISATKDLENLKIIVENPFDAETSQPFKGTGFGLSSIRRRLFLLYGREGLITTEKDGELFTTTILIPQMVSGKNKITENKLNREINNLEH